MKKIVLFVATLFLLVPVVGAVNVNPDQTQNITLKPDESGTVSFSLGLNKSEEEVSISSSNTGNYMVFFSKTSFTSNGNLNAMVQAPSSGNYTKTFSVNFESTWNDTSGNNSSIETETITRNVKAVTKIPFDSIRTKWINGTNYFVVNGNNHNISKITSNHVYIDNNRQLTTLNTEDIVFEELTTTPFGNAEVKIKTKNGAVVEVKREKQETECKLFISTQGGTTIKRDKMFYFRTVNKPTGKAVGNVYVRLMRSTDGSLLGKTNTDDYGYGSIQIPEKLGSKTPNQVTQVVIRVQKKDSGCSPSRRTLSPGSPYGDYIKGKDRFELKIKMDKENFTNELIKGQVVNKKGNSISTGVIKVKKPGGETDIGFQNHTFTYNASKGGNYQFKATKTNYVGSGWVKVNYVSDKDGDGIGEGDECPDVKGEKKNNGCPLKEVEINVPFEPKKGKEYGISLLYNKSIMNYSGKIEVKTPESDEWVDFAVKNGTTTLPLEQTGDYEVKFNGTSSLEKATADFEVKSNSILKNVPVVWVIVGLVVVVGLIVLVYLVSGGSSTTEETITADIVPPKEEQGG